MKKTSILMSLGLMAMATACGGGAKSAKYGAAINKPTGTVSQATTTSAVDKANDSKGAPNLASAFGGIQSNVKRQDLLPLAAAGNWAGNTDFVNMLSIADSYVTRETTPEQNNPFAQLCSDPNIKKAFDEAQGRGSNEPATPGCSASANVALRCLESNKVVELAFNGSVDCSGSSDATLKKVKYSISAVLKFGEYKQAQGSYVVLEGQFNATVKDKEETLKVSLGGGAMIEGDKAVGAAVVFIDDAQSFVFYSLNESSGGSVDQSDLASNKALCLKGANGTFVVQCQSAEDEPKCALWKGETTASLTLVGSSIEPAPATPSDANCATSGLLSKLGDFVAL